MHAQFRTAVANKLELEKTSKASNVVTIRRWQKKKKKMCITVLSKHNNKGNILRLLVHCACTLHTHITIHVLM